MREPKQGGGSGKKDSFLSRLMKGGEEKEAPSIETPGVPSDEIIVNMGPQHPSTHGVLRVMIRTDGEWIREVRPYLGYLHRCFEKVAENIEYPQVVPYTDRLDYLASMNNGQGFCMAVEKLAGIEVPERGEYCRIIAAELNRIASHLLAFGTFGLDVGAFTPMFHAFREREEIVTVLEKMSGQRLLYHYIRLGGVAYDITEEVAQDILRVCDLIDGVWDEYNQLLTYNEIFLNRCVNVGVLSRERAIAYGCTGPMGRASGIDWDLRRDQPYSVYPEFEFEVPKPRLEIARLGDSWQRHWIRVAEIRESVRILRQAIDKLPEGPHQGKVKAIVKPEKSEVFSLVENPRGELGYYIVSDGKGKGPWRCHVRAPSFCNLSVLPELATECQIADLVAILGSIDIVLGEVDR